MIKTGSPRRLWTSLDHCLKLKARIRSCTAHDMYVPDSETPEAMMKGETADIRQIREFG